ncbi:hypothetical protein BDZ91DRAFT_834499 [Kalaharituber pfeilii]|nr:hypothetical protein BDZ91DRAFT_834499 [Kalaharituber pfeilii]
MLLKALFIWGLCTAIWDGLSLADEVELRGSCRQNILCDWVGPRNPIAQALPEQFRAAYRVIRLHCEPNSQQHVESTGSWAGESLVMHMNPVKRSGMLPAGGGVAIFAAANGRARAAACVEQRNAVTLLGGYDDGRRQAGRAPAAGLCRPGRSCAGAPPLPRWDGGGGGGGCSLFSQPDRSTCWWAGTPRRQRQRQRQRACWPAGPLAPAIKQRGLAANPALPLAAHTSARRAPSQGSRPRRSAALEAASQSLPAPSSAHAVAAVAAVAATYLVSRRARLDLRFEPGSGQQTSQAPSEPPLAKAS